jgi:hypothetical protein
MKSVSISLAGDSRYRDALSVVAKRRNKNIGELVRKALDDSYGPDIEEALSFFADAHEYVQDSAHEITDGEEAERVAS